MKPLRLPTVLAFAIVGTSAAVATFASCGDAEPRADASPCAVHCIPTGSNTGSNCPPPTCVDAQGNCPAGCEPEPIV